MKELIPILLGIAASWVMTMLVRRRLPTVARLGFAGLVGGLATLLTGEFLESWAFLLIDIPLGAVGGLVASELLVRRRAPIPTFR